MDRCNRYPRYHGYHLDSPKDSSDSLARVPDSQQSTRTRFTHLSPYPPQTCSSSTPSHSGPFRPNARNRLRVALTVRAATPEVLRCIEDLKGIRGVNGLKDLSERSAFCVHKTDGSLFLDLELWIPGVDHLRSVFARVCNDNFGSTRVVLQELGDVVYVSLGVSGWARVHSARFSQVKLSKADGFGRHYYPQAHRLAAADDPDPDSHSDSDSH
jgi:hypothetical protein